MTKLISVAQMRSLEAAAIASGRVTGLDLMERAGRGVVAAVLVQWPELFAGSGRAVVLCGPGNNGGDGFVVARVLKERGWEVEVFLYAEPAKLPPDARLNYERWVGMGSVSLLSEPGNVERFCQFASHARDLDLDPGGKSRQPFLLVDALFGIGLSRALSGLDEIIRHWDNLINFQDMNDSRVVAIDICSGLDADTGDILYGADITGPGVLPADLTVTFHAMKTGHVSGRWSSLCGKVVVVDIGLGEASDNR